MAERVEINVIANDLASAALDLVKNKLMSIGGTTALVGTAALTMGAAVVTGLAKATTAAQAYDQQVYELMLRTGGTAEQTSRLIQVVDDAGISYQTLETAMKFAVKNGIEPNVQSLAALSDEYLSLNSGVERGQFLLDKFGRSGMDMARIMDLGGNAILDMNEAVEANLVLTDEAIRASEEYRKNVDQLNDSWEGFKVKIGNEVIPAINSISDAMQNAADRQRAWDQLRAQGAVYYDAEAVDLQVLKNRHDEWASSMDGSSTMMDHLITSTENGNTALEEQAKALAEVEKAQQTLLNQTVSLTKDFEDYNETLEDLNKTREEEQAILDDLVSRGYKETSDAVVDQQGKIKDLDGQIDELKESQKDQMHQFVLSMMQQKGATVEMQTAYALAAGLIDEKTYDMVMSIDQLTTSFIETGESVQNAKWLINDLIDKAELLDGTEVYMDVYIQTHGSIPSGYTSGNAGNTIHIPDAGGADAPVIIPPEGDVPYGGMQARGGDVFAGQMYSVGEYGREFFAPKVDGRVIPEGNMGGGVVLNLTYAPMISGFDRNEMTSKLLPFIRDGLRQIKAGA